MVKQELGLAQRFSIKYSKFNIKNSDKNEIEHERILYNFLILM